MKVLGRKHCIIGLTFILFFGISIGCYLVYFKDPVVAKVGSTKIYKSDVLFRNQLIQLAFPRDTRGLGLHQLVKSAVNGEILRNHGIPVTESVLKIEEERINRDSRAPEELQNIKSLFGPDKEAYRRAYIFPTLVDRVIYYDFFLTDEDIHQETMKQAKALIEESQNDEKRFRQLAESRGLRVQNLTLSLKEGVLWESQRPLPDQGKDKTNEKINNKIKMPAIVPVVSESEDAKRWHDLILRDLKVGQIGQQPISYGNDLLVLHYLKNPKPDVFELEAAILPKMEFNSWYEQERAKIKIEIYDKSYPIIP